MRTRPLRSRQLRRVHHCRLRRLVADGSELESRDSGDWSSRHGRPVAARQAENECGRCRDPGTDSRGLLERPAYPVGHPPYESAGMARDRPSRRTTTAHPSGSSRRHDCRRTCVWNPARSRSDATYRFDRLRSKMFIWADVLSVADTDMRPSRQCRGRRNPRSSRPVCSCVRSAANRSPIMRCSGRAFRTLD